jgi:hypothetical protein
LLAFFKVCCSIEIETILAYKLGMGQFDSFVYDTEAHLHGPSFLAKKSTLYDNYATPKCLGRLGRHATNRNDPLCMSGCPRWSRQLVMV